MCNHKRLSHIYLFLSEKTLIIKYKVVALFKDCLGMEFANCATVSIATETKGLLHSIVVSVQTSLVRRKLNSITL